MPTTDTAATSTATIGTVQPRAGQPLSRCAGGHAGSPQSTGSPAVPWRTRPTTPHRTCPTVGRDPARHIVPGSTRRLLPPWYAHPPRVAAGPTCYSSHRPEPP
ncbi:hypothetical protein Asera_65550 [Actinocatenispora sera]|uniref:Uncharacterized protein n=1 Tax=Actinocatenispora sera TaxID=390989 RepID=A0A810LB02_9ACTN|nr:hypothetical protein Asera_65550 [Actinocatenispora sera]